MAVLTVKASVELLDRVLAFVDGHLEELDCPVKTQMQIDVAVEEVYVNIAHYAYAPEEGEVRISVETNAKDRSVSIEFRDRGIPFDPLAKPDPDITLPASQRKIGGLGIFMVKKNMDTLRYSYSDGQNILVITKYLP